MKYKEGMSKIIKYIPFKATLSQGVNYFILLCSLCQIDFVILVTLV